MMRPTRSALDGRDPAIEAELAPHLSGLSLGRPLYAFARVGSTMEIAHALAGAGAPEGALVWAACQEAGRGRFGRAWASPEGGVYGSIILRPRRAEAELPQLSLVAGLAAAQTIHALSGAPSWVRWPNDILLGDRKVAGILLEARAGAVVLGIGVNVATPDRELPVDAISLIAAGAACTLARVTGGLCRNVGAWYDAWSRHGFSPIRDALRPRLMLGRFVHLVAGPERVEGQAVDLDESGRLLVRLESGVVRAFEAGEVTLLR